MRISPLGVQQTLLNALNSADQAEQNALQQIASGKRVNVPSDDPTAAAVEVQLSARSCLNDQFLRSAASIGSELQVADSALNSVVTALQRALTLGVQGANGTLSASDRSALGAEVQGIAQQVLQTANLTFNGRYLFAGTATSQPPYVLDTTAPGGVRYQGNDAVNRVEIEDGQQLATNLPGSKLFSAAGVSVFETLNNLANALESGNFASQDISDATAALRQSYDQVNSSRTFYGNTLDQLNSAQDFLNAEKVQLAQQINVTVGVDANQAASNLVNAENARSAALAAAARTTGMSLLDYLANTGG